MYTINTNDNYTKLFSDIKLKKQYLQKLNDKINLLNNLKENNYKSLSYNLFSKNPDKIVQEDFLVSYIIDITFSRSNIFLHVMDFSGNVKFFYSAGVLGYSGKRKRSRFTVIKDFYKLLNSKLKFLQGQPLALNLKNAGFSRRSIIEQFKKKFFIKVVQNYDLYPYNGCRKKKMKRKKIRKKRLKKRL